MTKVIFLASSSKASYTASNEILHILPSVKRNESEDTGSSMMLRDVVILCRCCPSGVW